VVLVTAFRAEAMTTVPVLGGFRSAHRIRHALFAAMACVMASCSVAPAISPAEAHRPPLSPSETYVLQALFRGASTPLSVHPLCEELTGAAGSGTMARYIAAILAEHGPDTANGLDVQASAREGLDYWEVDFRPLSGTEKDPQLWGLKFRIQEGGIALPESFRCYMAWEGWW
jgi:hypothetical protein